MLMRVCNRCGKRIPVGTQCSCVPPRQRDPEANREAQRKYDRTKRNPEAAAFYASDAWHRTRKAVWARAYGLDEYIYHTTGRAVRADTVHHIEELDDRPDLAYDMGNLVCVSRQTHRMVHIKYRNKKDKASLQKTLRESIGAVKLL